RSSPSDAVRRTTRSSPERRAARRSSVAASSAAMRRRRFFTPERLTTSRGALPEPGAREASLRDLARVGRGRAREARERVRLRELAEELDGDEREAEGRRVDGVLRVVGESADRDDDERETERRSAERGAREALEGTVERRDRAHDPREPADE